MTDNQAMGEEQKRDIELVASVLSTGKSVFIQSIPIGEKVEIEEGYFYGERLTQKGKDAKGEGLKHIIEERVVKDQMGEDDITALIMTVIDTVRTGTDLSTENDKKAGYSKLEKQGIIAILSKRNNAPDSPQWLLTGFRDSQNKESATEAIATFKSNYSYAPEYFRLRKQVGAVIASLSLHKASRHFTIV